MGLSRTVAAVLVLAGLVAFLYYYEYKGETAREEAERMASRALGFSTPEVRRLLIERPGGDVEIVRKDGAWRIASPIATRADDRSVEDVLRDLGALRVERTLEGIDASERKNFGLEEPAARITIETGASAENAGDDPRPTAPLQLSIGAAVPVTGGRYAVRPGEDGVMVTVGSLDSVVGATAETLRQRKLIGIDSWDVRRVAMKSRAKSLALEKRDGMWHIDDSGDPNAAASVPADEAGVDALLASLASAVAAGFADESPAAERLSSLGLTAETGALEVEVAGDSVSTRAVLGAVGADGTSWARRSDMEAVMIVPRSLREGVAAALETPASLRDPRPARFNRFALSRLDVTTPDGAARPLFKSEESTWHLGAPGGARLPSERVNAILDALERLVADRWSGAQEPVTGRETLSIVLTEDRPTEGEASPDPLKLTFWTTEDAGGTTVGSSIASLRYVVPAGSAAKLLDAVRLLEEPVPGDGGKGAESPDAGAEDER